jgi:hypothetical protein
MNIEARIEKLERVLVPSQDRRWHQAIGTEAECQTAVRALIDAGQAQESDRIIFRIIVATGEATRPSTGREAKPSQLDWD